MHSTFTGSTRRRPQVNLAGNRSTNPWATTSNLGHSSTAGASNPVAQAKAAREKREQEKKRLVATQRIQKLWRGHWCRRRQKAAWRRTWDENEKERLGLEQILDYQRLIDEETTIPAYATSTQVEVQLRLLLRYQEFRKGKTRDRNDTFRLLYCGLALQRTLPPQPDWSQTLDVRPQLSQLGLTLARHLESVARGAIDAQYVPRLLSLLAWLTDQIPENIADNAAIYFDVLENVRLEIDKLFWEDGVVKVIASLLTQPQTRKQPAYTAFAKYIMGGTSASQNLDLITSLARSLDLGELSRAIINDLEVDDASHQHASTTDHALWQLAYLIHIHGTCQNTAESQQQYIEAFSALLSTCANDIVERLDTANHSTTNGSHKPSAPPLPNFIYKTVVQLPRPDQVRATLQEMGSLRTGSNSNFDSAKHLADFAVAMLRAFPQKALDIRMALYQGSIRADGAVGVSTLQYLWNTARLTNVFGRVARDHRNVLSILREAAPASNQIGQAAPSRSQLSHWRNEWKIVLLFLELYTFILKMMDDEEFFLYDKSHSFEATVNSAATSMWSMGALPLEDVVVMTSFLKNLAFVLYWNASDLVESNMIQEQENLSALFGAQQPDLVQPEKKQQTLTGNGVSQDYLKGLVTGLLRMLHERDSRRPFVPAGHWLMTNQVSMTGFIPAVVAEEEKRHEFGDDDDELDDQPTSLDEVEEVDDYGGLNAESALMNMFGIRPAHNPRSRDSRSARRLEQQVLQARKKRQIASLAPRLEILRNLPFFIPFETRVHIFRQFIYRDQERRRDGFTDAEGWRLSVAARSMQGRGFDGRPPGMDVLSRHHAEIHRESVFDDAYDSFYQLGDSLKEPIQITFIDKFGAPEAGIDGGGVTKEFLTSVTSEAFDPDAESAMFKENSQRFLYPNPLIFQEQVEYLRRAGLKPRTDAYEIPKTEFLRRYEFLGRVVGKCLYEGILIDVTFAGFFLLKWALTGGTTTATNESAYRATINDLRGFDDELYSGLLKLKNYPGDVENDFGLDMTVTDTITIEDHNGRPVTRTVTKDLVNNGSKTPVTNQNRLIYIDRIVRYRLQEQPRAVTDAFLRGLGQIIQPMWLAMFNQKELQNLVGGDNTELDIADLRRNTQYGGLYVIGDDGLEHPTVQLFWRALAEMSDEDRRRVLKFVTSTPRAPLLGFGHLNPRFSIRDSSEDQSRLPSTSTCVNLLKLPRYGNLGVLREKLLYAVNSGAGFDLS